MSEMVERLARIIDPISFEVYTKPSFGRVQCHETARATACAVLEAMREPTLEMLAAIPGYSGRPYEQEVWRLMIDAALDR